MRKTKSITTAAKSLSTLHVTLLAPEDLKAEALVRDVAGENLLGWIRHLGAKETQRLETLADGVDVGHSHKHHLTVGIVFCRREGGKR